MKRLALFFVLIISIYHVPTDAYADTNEGRNWRTYDPNHMPVTPMKAAADGAGVREVLDRCIGIALEMELIEPDKWSNLSSQLIWLKRDLFFPDIEDIELVADEQVLQALLEKLLEGALPIAVSWKHDNLALYIDNPISSVDDDDDWFRSREARLWFKKADYREGVIGEARDYCEGIVQRIRQK